jgi:hypothetical protein
MVGRRRISVGSYLLTSIVSGQTSAGALSPPTTLKAREAGLNLISDVGKLNIPGLQAGFGTAESFLKNNPNTAFASLKARLAQPMQR